MYIILGAEKEHVNAICIPCQVLATEPDEKQINLINTEIYIFQLLPENLIHSSTILLTCQKLFADVCC